MEVNARRKLRPVQESNVNSRDGPSGVHLCRNVIVQCCNSVMSL
jgi:hypothetical protein